jgi:hypothetical protein
MVVRRSRGPIRREPAGERSAYTLSMGTGLPMHLTPRMTAAVALSILAYLHLDLAPAYDTVGEVVTQGILLRMVAALAMVAAVVVLQFDHPVAYTAGLLAAGITVVTVVTAGWAGSVAGLAAVVAVGTTAVLAARGWATERCHRQLRVSLGTYVLDRLPADEHGAVESHLLACSRCRTEVAELAPVAAVLGRADRDLVAAHFPEALPWGAAPSRAVPVPRRATPSASRETPNNQ